MLFNSADFLFGFLPASLLIVWLLEKLVSRSAAISALGALSVLFYAHWDPSRVWVILVSIGVNYAFVRWIVQREGQARLLLTSIGIVLNLSFLFYFKYSSFAWSILEQSSAFEFRADSGALPIGISFFTFQQIAFLVDAYRRVAAEADIRRYILFVAFFPQLIAGPIVHHREMMPQFDKKQGRLAENFSVGFTIFVLGLAKKMLLADSFANISTPSFDATAAGLHIDFFEAWLAALAYTLQIYFDFSGYSDMAIGLARMFGIRLPINFASPYKASSLVDFWKRWHITLSRFLREYLYFPLGGNRRGRPRTYLNIVITMLLGGIWHGAGWTFATWGAMHAVGIALNHLWLDLGFSGWLRRPISWLLTFTFIVVAWVPFRAETIAAAGSMYSSMIGLNGFSLPHRIAPLVEWLSTLGLFEWLAPETIGFRTPVGWIKLTCGLALVLLMPNTQTLTRNFEPGLRSPGYPSPIENGGTRHLAWRPTPAYGVVLGLLLTACLAKLNDVSEFIYFQF